MAKGLRKPKEEEKEIVKANQDVEVSMKSAANPADDKTIKDAAEVQTLDVFDRVEANKTVEPQEVEEVKVTKENPNVRIKPNQKIRTFIGDSWYNLEQGKVASVPQTVKAILQKAGMLDAL